MLHDRSELARTMPMQQSSRQVLRYVYLLSAVCAVTCAGLTGLFSWRHLGQHATEAAHVQRGLDALAEIARLQSMAIRGVTAADRPRLAESVEKLARLHAGSDHADLAKHADALVAAWKRLDPSLTSPPAELPDAAQTPAGLGEFIAELDALREHQADALLDDPHRHSGSLGWGRHLLVAAGMLLFGGVGVACLLAAIVRSQREVERAHALLESKVADRTEQLAAKNAELSAEIDHRRRLEQEIVTIAGEEQRRIAHELHDDLGQQLTALSLHAKHLERELARDRAPLVVAAAELSQQLKASTEALRRIVRRLYPTAMSRDELVDALTRMMVESGARHGVRCTFDRHGDLPLDDRTKNVHLYGIAREAVANALRHAKPTQVAVTLAGSDAGVELTIADDGTGMHGNGERGAGMGLRLMAYRADILRGRLEIKPGDPRGTVVRVSIPGPAIE
jgi:signal transduction histidine kinase